MKRCKNKDDDKGGCVKRAGHGGRCKARACDSEEFARLGPGDMVPHGEPFDPPKPGPRRASRATETDAQNDRTMACMSELAIALGHRPMPCQGGLLFVPDAGRDRVVIVTPSCAVREGNLKLNPAAG